MRRREPQEPGENHGAYPSGRQPYDIGNGLRIGALSGAISGLIAVAIIGTGGLVAVILLGAAGAVIGFVWERRTDVERRR